MARELLCLPLVIVTHFHFLTYSTYVLSSQLSPRGTPALTLFIDSCYFHPPPTGRLEDYHRASPLISTHALNTHNPPAYVYCLTTDHAYALTP